MMMAMMLMADSIQTTTMVVGKKAKITSSCKDGMLMEPFSFVNCYIYFLEE
jgi:hypothetical protein